MQPVSGGASATAPKSRAGKMSCARRVIKRLTGNIECTKYHVPDCKETNHKAHEALVRKVGGYVETGGPHQDLG